MIINQPIIVEQSFNVSIKTVWNAITEIDQMRQWFFNNIEDFKDKILDKINVNSFKVIEDEIKKENAIIAEALVLFSVVKKFERVGDLLKNIAEEIIFYIDAEILKHRRKK